MKSYLEQVIRDHRTCELECYQCSFDLVSRLLSYTETPHENCVCARVKSEGRGYFRCPASRCPGHPETGEIK